MTKFSSFTKEPKPGHLAHVNMGRHHERTLVHSVAEDGSWALLFHQTPIQEKAVRDDRDGWVLEESGHPVRFTYIPQVGDVAKYNGLDGEAHTRMVSAISTDPQLVPALIVLTGGEWAILRSWGSYSWGSTNRSVEFTPYPVDEIMDLLSPVHSS